MYSFSTIKVLLNFSISSSLSTVSKPFSKCSTMFGLGKKSSLFLGTPSAVLWSVSKTFCSGILVVQNSLALVQKFQ